MYVTVKVSDGLGNRLFQVAAMLGYAETHGHTPIFIQEWILNDVSHPGPHPITAYFPAIPVVSLAVVDTPWTHIREPSGGVFTYSPLPYTAGNVCLEGWFQVAAYGPTYRIHPEILTHESCDFDLSAAAFLHVRRGDYLNPLCAHHNVDLTAYIRRSLALFDADTRIVVCSDDITWCKATLPRLYGDCVRPERWVWVDENAHGTLAIMMRCARGGICANSTFSWWGAYFGSRDLVCMPAVWGYPPMPVAVDVWPTWAVKVPV